MIKAFRWIVVAGIITGSTQPVISAPAFADTASTQAACGANRDTSTSGAQAYWIVRCSKGNITVEGWVKDISADGECAQVKAHFPGDIWEFSQDACPKNTKKSFKWTHPGDIVDIYLFEHK